MAYQLFRLFRFVVTYLWRLVWAVIWPVAEPIAKAIAKRSPVDFNLFYGLWGHPPLSASCIRRVASGFFSIEVASWTLEFYCPDSWDERVCMVCRLVDPLC